MAFFVWGKRIGMKMNPSATKVMVPWIFDLRSSFSYGEPSVHRFHFFIRMTNLSQPSAPSNIGGFNV